MTNYDKEKSFLIDYIRRNNKLGIINDIKEEAIFEGADPNIVESILNDVINKHRNDFVLTIAPGNYYTIFTGKVPIVIKDIEEYGK